VPVLGLCTAHITSLADNALGRSVEDHDAPGYDDGVGRVVRNGRNFCEAALGKYAPLQDVLIASKLWFQN
jgi:hypothetical protein